MFQNKIYGCLIIYKDRAVEENIKLSTTVCLVRSVTTQTALYVPVCPGYICFHSNGTLSSAQLLLIWLEQNFKGWFMEPSLTFGICHSIICHPDIFMGDNCQFFAIIILHYDSRLLGDNFAHQGPISGFLTYHRGSSISSCNKAVPSIFMV